MPPIRTFLSIAIPTAPFFRGMPKPASYVTSHARDKPWGQPLQRLDRIHRLYDDIVNCSLFLPKGARNHDTHKSLAR